MITLVRTYKAQSGKAFELLGAVQASVAVGTRVSGIELTVATVVGGVVGEVAVLSKYDNLGHLEETLVKLMASSEWRAANTKVQELSIAGQAHDHILRHV